MVYRAQFPVDFPQLKESLPSDTVHFPSHFLECFLRNYIFVLFVSFLVGETSYVARVNDSLFVGYDPGALVPSTGMVSIPHGCKEHTFTNYEVLTSDDPAVVYWKTCSDGEVPEAAIEAGVASWEEMYIGQTHGPLNVGMASNGKHLCPPENFTGPLLGKIHPSHHCLYVAYNGKEYMFSTYNVLCKIQMPPFVHVSSAETSWVKASDGRVPPYALPAGITPTGEVAYVGRALQDYLELVPGPVVTSEGCLRLSWASIEHRHQEYEVLVADDPNVFEWVWGSQGDIPRIGVAVPGFEGEKETIYIGRTVTGSNLSVGRTYQGVPIQIPRLAVPNTQLVGKIHPSHRCLYLPHTGLEFIYKEYEVLVAKLMPKSLQELCQYVIRMATNGVPARIDSLSLPFGLKESCKVLM